MQLASIVKNRAYVALIPKRNTEILAVVMPLIYLGSSRWKIRNSQSGRSLYVSSRKILRPATVEEEASGVILVEPAIGRRAA